MKTIEEAAKEVWVKDLAITDFFRSGVEFAQRWIPVEEEELPMDKPFFSKSSNNDEFVSLCAWNDCLLKFNPIANGIHQSNLTIENITHWRPIELK